MRRDPTRAEERQILELRMQGHSTLEISEQLKVTDRKVRRKMERVRELAAKEELGPMGDGEADE